MNENGKVNDAEMINAESMYQEAHTAMVSIPRLSLMQSL